jgi:hypothetical protein
LGLENDAAIHYPPHMPQSLSADYIHRKIGFQDELRALLRKHEIEWDEKYEWD